MDKKNIEQMLDELKEVSVDNAPTNPGGPARLFYLLGMYAVEQLTPDNDTEKTQTTNND